MDNGEDIDPSEDAAFCQRVARYLDGKIKPDDLKLLNSELLAGSAKQITFIRICTVRAALIREGAANRIAGELSVANDLPPALGHETSRGTSVDCVHQLDETMILPAIRDESPANGSEDESEKFSISPTRNVMGLKRINRKKWLGWAATAAVFMMATALTWTLRPGRRQAADRKSPVSTATSEIEVAAASATVTAVAGSDVVFPGTRLENGQQVVLHAGAIELTFDSGATVLVRGPAQIQIAGRNAMTLDSGSLYAHIPQQAIGFTVSAPGLRVLDHGTNFGVRTSSAGDGAELHVFDGLVDATGRDSSGKLLVMTTPVRAGQAVSHSLSSPETRVSAIPFSAKLFDRNISQIRTIVETHGTGTTKAADSLDPYWRIISVSGDAGWRPRSASVATAPRPEYVPNSTTSNWISVSADIGDAPAATYDYRTTLDLTGFDPQSVSVKATLAADDSVADLLVNEQSTGLVAAQIQVSDPSEWRTKSHEVDLSHVVWKPGKNQVDFLVINAPGPGWPNCTGLQVGWSVTASLAVRR